MPKCDIIIPIWNQLKITKICLGRILECTNYDYGLTIIDNGSDEKTKEFLKEFVKSNIQRKINLITNTINEGFIKAINKGIRQSTGAYVCILNNDTITTKGWLAEMIKILEDNPDIGIVNPSSNNLGQKIPKNMIEDYAEKIKPNSGKYAELMSCLGFCMLLRRSLIDEIGFFDEIYGMGNFEDTDFSMRVKKKGYRCVRALAAYVYHCENTSFNFLKKYRYEFERNRKIFEERWGKRKRVLIIIKDNTSKNQKYNYFIKNELEKNNLVYVASKMDFFFPLNYSGLTIYRIKTFFNVHIFLKILFKKKRFDNIYCDKKNILELLDFFKPIHKADISLF